MPSVSSPQPTQAVPLQAPSHRGPPGPGPVSQCGLSYKLQSVHMEARPSELSAIVGPGLSVSVNTQNCFLAPFKLPVEMRTLLDQMPAAWVLGCARSSLYGFTRFSLPWNPVVTPDSKSLSLSHSCPCAPHHSLLAVTCDPQHQITGCGGT